MESIYALLFTSTINERNLILAKHALGCIPPFKDSLKTIVFLFVDVFVYSCSILRHKADAELSQRTPA